MPEETTRAYQDHGIVAPTLERGLDEAKRVFEQLAWAGVDSDDLTATLEKEGVQRFADSFRGTAEHDRGEAARTRTSLNSRTRRLRARTTNAGVHSSRWIKSFQIVGALLILAAYAAAQFGAPDQRSTRVPRPQSCRLDRPQSCRLDRAHQPRLPRRLVGLPTSRRVWARVSLWGLIQVKRGQPPAEVEPNRFRRRRRT